MFNEECEGIYVKLKAFKTALPYTLPICIGFLFIGMSYGLLMQSKDFSLIYPIVMSCFIFAGSMEFVTVNTITTRFLPFIIFPEGKTPPPFITYLGGVLPYAVIGLLVVYCLKDSVYTDYHGLPELISIIFIVILHKWKKNMLISLGAGTVIYMILVQTIFA